MAVDAKFENLLVYSLN